jgi:hypothetical protein
MMRMRTMSKASRSRYSHITPLSLERRAVRAFGNVRTGGGSVGDGGGGRCGGVTGGCYSYSLDTLERPRVPAPQGGSGMPGGGTAGREVLVVCRLLVVVLGRSNLETWDL